MLPGDVKRKFLDFELWIPNHLARLQGAAQVEEDIKDAGEKILIRMDRHKFGPQGLRADIKRQVGLGPWKALTPKYLAAKERAGYMLGIWTRTGRWLKAVSTIGSGASKTIKIDRAMMSYEVFFDESQTASAAAEIAKEFLGMDVPGMDLEKGEGSDSVYYWRWVDKGTRKMPARPLVGWKAEDGDMLSKIAAEEIMRAYLIGGKALVELKEAV